jgi:hypothetical protein
MRARSHVANQRSSTSPAATASIAVSAWSTSVDLAFASYAASIPPPAPWMGPGAILTLSPDFRGECKDGRVDVERRRLWAGGAAALLMAVSLTGCGGDDGGVLPDVEGTTTTADVVAETTTTVLEVESTAAGTPLPRGFTYGNIEFTLTKLEFSNASPGTYLEDEPEPTAEQLLYVSFTAAFEDDFPGVYDEWDADNFQLVTSAGRTIAASGVDFRSNISVSGRTPTEATVVFPADADEVEGATFRLDDGTHLAAEVPLDGTVPADPYPITATVSGEAPVTYEGGCTDATGTVKVLGGEWDVDRGADAEGEFITGTGTQRTLDDNRYLRVRVQSVASAGTCGGTIVNGDHFRLVVDGLPIGSDNVKRSALLANGEGKEFVWGYAVPADAESVTLEVGTTGGTVATFPVTVPALP